MIGDIACLGICIVDPETGICQGCGRGPEEVTGVSDRTTVGTDDCTCKKIATTPLSVEQAQSVPLPPQVVRQIGPSSD